MPVDPALSARLEPFRTLGWMELLQDPEQLAAYTKAFTAVDGYVPPSVTTRDDVLDGPIGPFRVRVYEPAPTGDRPVLVWAHGGGFMRGDLEMPEADVVCREICARAGAVVVSVDYHVADGSVSYPTLHEEVAAAARWVIADAGGLGADKARVTLGGASAGANLALAAALMLRAAAEPLPRALALVYPSLHRTLVPQPGIGEELERLPPTLRFDQAAVDGMFAIYVGDQSHAPWASVEGNDLDGLPPTLVVVCEYDDLRSSGERFAHDARAAGVDVALYVARGMPHGHLNMTPAVAETDATLDRLAAVVRAPSV